MESLINSLKNQKNWKQFMKKSCRKNKLSVDIASYFTLNKIEGVYDRFAKIYEIKSDSNDICWLQNQLKTFHWVLVGLSAVKDILIENFHEEQWNLMNKIFLNKDQSVLEYESIKLVNERINKNRVWNQEQTQFLTEIIKQHQNSNKWNDIARKLFQKSNHKYFRSGKQCRQRWLNHLDPSKKRGEWSEQEDKLIINSILTSGKRWSNISKQLGNQRTEHMVKNRYKTLIIRQKKLTPKISNENTLTKQIGKLMFGQEAINMKKQIRHKIVKDIEIENGKTIEENMEVQIIKSSRELTKSNEKIKQSDKNQLLEKMEEDIKEKPLFKNDPILSQVMEDYSKSGTVSTPINNYQLQQVYSPFYLSYQGITPFLSTSPTLPFFMNSSFSAFDNSFNNSLFTKNNSPSEKNDQN